MVYLLTHKENMLIDRIYSNLSIEKPEVTREQVVDRYQLKKEKKMKTKLKLVTLPPVGHVIKYSSKHEYIAQYDASLDLYILMRLYFGEVGYETIGPEYTLDDFDKTLKSLVYHPSNLGGLMYNGKNIYEQEEYYEEGQKFKVSYSGATYLGQVIKLYKVYYICYGNTTVEDFRFIRCADKYPNGIPISRIQATFGKIWKIEPIN